MLFRSSALELGLAAMYAPGTAVRVPVWTHGATAAAAVFAGLRVKLTDIGEDLLMAADGPGVPVHFAGALAPVGEGDLEDSAHTLAPLRGRAAAYSFYATKPVSCGEGGMLATNEEDLADYCRLRRAHGVKRSDRPWDYDIVTPGSNYRMPDMLAAIARVQLRKYDAGVKARSGIWDAYTESLSGLVDTPPRSTSYHLFVIRLRLDELRIDRDRFIELMGEAGIQCSVHYKPLHLMHHWRGYGGGQLQAFFPVATREYPRVVSLPIYPGVDHARVSEAVIKIIQENQR